MIAVLIRALANMLVAIELADDDAVDPETAAQLLDDLAADLEDLSDEDAHRVLTELHALAAAEPDPDRRAILVDLPDDLGLSAE
jgi:hypothetical protein